MDRVCAHQVGNTDCAGWCWEWGGLIRRGKGVKETKREKQVREAKDRYNVISLMGMCLHALKFRENTRFH